MIFGHWACVFGWCCPDLFSLGGHFLWHFDRLNSTYGRHGNRMLPSQQFEPQLQKKKEKKKSMKCNWNKRAEGQSDYILCQIVLIVCFAAVKLLHITTTFRHFAREYSISDDSNVFRLFRKWNWLFLCDIVTLNAFPWLPCGHGLQIKLIQWWMYCHSNYYSSMGLVGNDKPQHLQEQRRRCFLLYEPINLGTTLFFTLSPCNEPRSCNQGRSRPPPLQRPLLYSITFPSHQPGRCSGNVF